MSRIYFSNSAKSTLLTNMLCRVLLFHLFELASGHTSITDRL